MKTHFLVLALALFFVVSAAAYGGRRMNLDGVWEPIKDVSDPHVMEIAKFAVAEHNKNKEVNGKLVLSGVVSGEMQVVNGVNYKLVLAAEGGGADKYEAVVWEKDWINFKELISFKSIQ